MLRDTGVGDAKAIVIMPGTIAGFPVVIAEGEIVAASDPEHGEIWRWLREDAEL